MAALQSPLLSDAIASSNRCRPSPRRFLPALSMRYKPTCVTTKTGLFVLVVLAIVNAAGFCPVFYFITTPFVVGRMDVFLPGYAFFMIEFLMFPIAGLVGELCCKRFKILAFGSVLIATGLALFSIVYGLYIGVWNEKGAYNFLLFSIFLLVVPGVGIFQANALQYGVDQLDFASSDVLSSFIYWYYWTSYAFISQLIALSVKGEIVFIMLMLCVAAVMLMCLVCISIYCCYRNPHLRTDPGHKVNPLKLIWKVMEFAKVNKFPLRRSAFTYNEIPTRLDLAKQRYGGPFTTEEVEEVKSFWRILLVLASLIGFQLQDDTLFTMTGALFLMKQYCSHYLISTWTVSALVISLGIPVYQFGIRPYYSQHIFSMLTRTGLGLVLLFLSLLTTTMYNVLLSPATSEVYANFTETKDSGRQTIINISSSSLCNAVKNFRNTYNGTSVSCSTVYFTSYDDPLPSFYWLVVPQVLNAVAHMLVFLTILEFILAQAPSTMQGFLIGLWYAMQSVNLGISIFAYTSCAAFHWQYYASKALLVLLSLILYAIVVHKYKYRQLNEDADINLQQEVENVFERNFDREVLMMKDSYCEAQIQSK